MNQVFPEITADERQVGGSHYRDMQIQPWAAMEAWMTPEELRGYHKATAIAYLARERQKGGDDDIRKASHHLVKLCELLDAKSRPRSPKAGTPAAMSAWRLRSE